MKQKIPIILAIAILLTLLSFKFTPKVEAITTETRYMRSDQWADAYYKLNTTRTTTSKNMLINVETTVTRQYLGIRVWAKHADNSETELTSGTAIIIASGSTAGLKSASGTSPSGNLVSSDSIVVRVYADDFTPPTDIIATFETEQLGASNLDGATWTVYYYLLRTKIGTLYYYYFYWGTSTYDSNIANFQWSIYEKPYEEYRTHETNNAPTLFFGFALAVAVIVLLMKKRGA